MNQWKLINHTFKFREGDTDEKGGCTFIGGSWKDVTTDDLFKDRKVVIYSTCFVNFNKKNTGVAALKVLKKNRENHCGITF